MNCAVEYPSEEIIILHLSGRLDADGLNTIKADLSANQHLRYAIADMSQTAFIDSLGLAALVSILKVMRSRGGDFYIAKPTDVVRLVLELTRMNLAFFIAEDIDAALRHLQQIRTNTATVKLPVRLDAASVPPFRATILGEIDKGATRLVLDAAETQFIDSAGLALLVSSYKAITAKGGKLALAALQERAREIFTLTRMDSIFLIYPTVQEAVAALER